MVIIISVYNTQKVKGGRNRRTFKGGTLRDVECGVLPSNSILGVRPIGSPHLVEGGDAVAGLELGDVTADLVNDAGDVIALVIVII